MTIPVKSHSLTLTITFTLSGSGDGCQKRCTRFGMWVKGRHSLHGQLKTSVFWFLCGLLEMKVLPQQKALQVSLTGFKKNNPKKERQADREKQTYEENPAEIQGLLGCRLNASWVQAGDFNEPSSYSKLRRPDEIPANCCTEKSDFSKKATNPNVYVKSLQFFISPFFK